MAIQEIKFGYLGGGNEHAFGGTGSCSMKWLTGLCGEYDPVTRKYKGLNMNGQNYHSYTSPVLCLSSDQQNGPEIPKMLEDAGFIKLASWMSAHGGYKCHLWFFEPREGKSDQYNSGDKYKLYPNVDIYGDMAKSAGRFPAGDAALEAKNKELAKAAESLEKAEAAKAKLSRDVADKDLKIAELKAQLAEQRALRQSGKRSLPRSATLRATGATATARRLPGQRAKGLGMGRRLYFPKA